ADPDPQFASARHQDRLAVAGTLIELPSPRCGDAPVTKPSIARGRPARSPVCTVPFLFSFGLSGVANRKLATARPVRTGSRATARERPLRGRGQVFASLRQV